MKVIYVKAAKLLVMSYIKIFYLTYVLLIVAKDYISAMGKFFLKVHPRI